MIYTVDIIAAAFHVNTDGMINLCYREVQQLRAVVRESDQVKFAVHVYTALNSYNYVKFFKLVRSATFLNVCVLHRYFSQMRACCLQRLRAYVMPGHTAAVSLYLHVLFIISDILFVRWFTEELTILLLERKYMQNVFCHICYKTWPFLIKLDV